MYLQCLVFIYVNLHILACYQKTKILASERIILGIDPGSNVSGFGVVRAIGSKI